MEFASKLLPFRSGNRIWAVRLCQGYSVAMLIAIIMAALINAHEGELWMTKDKGQKQKAYGKTAFDECLWFTFTTLHGIQFGEFIPQSVAGDVLTSVVMAVSYWCVIFMAAIVMLSQLPGVKPQGLFSMISGMASIVWPSYAILVGIIFFAGYIVGPYAANGLSQDPRCGEKWNCENKFNLIGIQWLWSVIHRAPLGDIWPDKPFGRAITVPAAFISYLYPPYVLALIAIRRPTLAEHEQLLASINSYPEEAMGPGYVIPEEEMREVQMTSRT
mmetsp:Transcript_4832/g.6856  ORF Transcript_4832/g.6856 Transcript_4832/m.6856 type:complete len:273 (+) Transcript_4832:99-917(+)